MTSTDPLQISIVTSEALSRDQHARILALCSAAYEEDFTAYLGLLSPAVHVLGHVDGELVTHAAWVERRLFTGRLGALRAAYVEAVATAPDHQRRGYARALLIRIPPLLGEFELAALSPSDAGYYEPLGWEMWRGPLSYFDTSGAEIATPEEQIMIQRLPRTPAALDLDDTLSVEWRAIEVW